MTCGVYASAWIADRVKGTDEVFTHTRRCANDLTSPVKYFAGKCDVNVPGRYQMGSPVKDEGELNNFVMVTVCDNEPAPEYRQAAEVTKVSWGNMGESIVRNARTYLKNQANLASDEDRSDDALFNLYEGEEELETLLINFKGPGFKLWTLMSRNDVGGHLIASYGENDRLWIFDSLKGEASVPHAHLDDWFNSDPMKKYLAGYGSFTALDFSQG